MKNGVPKLFLEVAKVYTDANPEFIENFRRKGYEVRTFHQIEDHPSLDELDELMRDVDICVTCTENITSRMMDMSDQLKLITVFGAGFNNVDIEAATQRGIYVTNARGGNAIAVGEFSISLMVSLARLTHRSDAGMKQGIWTPGLGCELYGKTLGIMGLGAIGMETARIAHGGFNMKILACDVFENPLAKERYGVTYVSKEELFEQADFISVHTPLMDSTRGLLNWDLMSRMKQSAYLVNVSRGGIMDEDALLRLIEEGRIAGAALDVYSEEPYTQNAFAKFDNVITTSHIAASSIESVFRISNILTDNIEDVLQGKPPRSNILNPQVVPRLVK